MNYIELLNQFWQTRRRVRLSSNEADLYYFLMNESNSRMWENPFECTNILICATIGMSEKTLIDVRNRLVQKGLISVEAGQRKKKSPVYFLLYCKKESKNVSIEGSITESKTVSKTPNIIYKLNKEENSIDKEKENTLNFPFTSDLFLEKWNLLVSTPKWKNKISQSLQLSLDTLAKYDETFSIEMINQAIAGEWSMFKGFELDEYYKKFKVSSKKPQKEVAKRFKPPTVDEVKAYCLQRKNNVDPQKFVDFYQSRGWKYGNTKITDWEACVRTWEKNNKNSNNEQQSGITESLARNVAEGIARANTNK